MTPSKELKWATPEQHAQWNLQESGQSFLQMHLKALAVSPNKCFKSIKNCQWPKLTPRMCLPLEKCHGEDNPTSQPAQRAPISFFSQNLALVQCEPSPLFAGNLQQNSFPMFGCKFLFGVPSLGRASKRRRKIQCSVFSSFPACSVSCISSSFRKCQKQHQKERNWKKKQEPQFLRLVGMLSPKLREVVFTKSSCKS